MSETRIGFERLSVNHMNSREREKHAVSRALGSIHIQLPELGKHTVSHIVIMTQIMTAPPRRGEIEISGSTERRGGNIALYAASPQHARH